MAEPIRDGPGHLLSLKVMRVSRPALASAWQPFYSSSPSFSAHSTASILSLQGKTPLPGHPKTLRDLTHASELLTLPSSFGSIQLGETFSSCLCVNNEAQVEIEAVAMKVEMQTVTAKVVLAEFGGADTKLSIGDTLEHVVHHEIKELGQHVLACTVTYRLPPGSRTAPGPAEDSEDPALQTFRKFYKFAVTNPLSVKTKVHAPRSPSALVSSAEREKVFLEVHIQNLTAETMWFERMRFECADGWDVVDANLIDVEGDDDSGSIFSGSTALMQPQDMRQYIYILSRKSTALVPVAPVPGSVIALGRLDISWRSSYGEPGRLLTSMLSRRIPLLPAPAQQPVSALPPYLKRNATISAGGPPRPHSPQLPQSRPGSPTPSQRPGSPFRNRPPSTVVGRPQTPPPQPAPLPVSDIDISLTVRDVPRDTIKLETPFKISFALAVSASVPAGRRRSLSLAVQHLQPPRVSAPTVFPPNPPPEPYSPRFTSPGFSTPSPMSTTFNYALAHQKLLAVSPMRQGLDDGGSGNTWSLPPPFFEGADELRFAAKPGVVFCGNSALFLPPLQFIRPAGDDGEKAEGDEDVKVQEMHDFELHYVPISRGFNTVGGLRVVLLEDKYLEESSDAQDDKPAFPIEPKILKEWDVVAEIWVST
ncbi:hypothetical protein B0H17DRAFT_1004426 [Mycena rosella]|uniref:DUF974-domain-containing protein n=1 Tax=Mycena rosella TaxID=1033263 RepID=A0AAD7DY08_MYCRO|nr:hypothetical protein B0H17DRAFT_1004426 [Mycena rosella]